MQQNDRSLAGGYQAGAIPTLVCATEAEVHPRRRSAAHQSQESNGVHAHVAVGGGVSERWRRSCVRVQVDRWQAKLEAAGLPIEKRAGPGAMKPRGRRRGDDIQAVE